MLSRLPGRVQVALPKPLAAAAPANGSSGADSTASMAAQAASAVAPAMPAVPAVVHALLPSLKARLGAPIGPRPASASTPDKELP